MTELGNSHSLPRRENDWRRLVERSLRGRPIEALASRTDDGLLIGSIYGAPAKCAGVLGRLPGVPWVVVQRTEDPDLQRTRTNLAADLAGGAGGIELVFSGSAAAKRSGSGSGFGLDLQAASQIASLIEPDVHLRIDAGEASYSVCRSFQPSAEAGLTLAYDPLAQAAARGGFDHSVVEIAQDIIDATKALEERKRRGVTVVADGRIWAAAGASEVQELSAILGSLAYLSQLLIGAGISAEAALRRIAIIVDAGANQHVTIAKFRAVRLIHARFVEAFGLPPYKAEVHAETSWRMMTRHDVHTNILRTTSAAFAAGIGGADSITVLPFTVAIGLPDAFARRVARNSQTILIEEAGLARVGDPAAGSGAIKSLTNALAEAAWEKFRATEASGGLLTALRSGSVQADIARMRKGRAERIARREIKITGVSEYPTLDDREVTVSAPRRLATKVTIPVSDTIEPLLPARLAEPFEALRDRAAALAATGKPPTIFLASFGASPDQAELEQMVVTFFAAGGIRAAAATHFDDAEAVATAFAASGARAACVVSPGEAPSGLALSSAQTLKSIGATRVYFASDQNFVGVVGLPGIDAIVGDGVDAVALLDDLLGAIETP